MDRERAPEHPQEERAEKSTAKDTAKDTAKRADAPVAEGSPAAASPGSEGGAAAPAPAPETPPLQLYIDRLQRLQADFDNFRRRSNQELREREDRTVAQVFRRLLPVVDDLRLAARAEEQSAEGITAGLRIILDKVAALLGEFSIEEISPVGSPFDPRWHEALAHRPSESAAPGVVLDELERGYRLRDLLVRPARVIVAKAPEAPPPEDG